MFSGELSRRCFSVGAVHVHARHRRSVRLFIALRFRVLTHPGIPPFMGRVINVVFDESDCKSTYYSEPERVERRNYPTCRGSMSDGGAVRFAERGSPRWWGLERRASGGETRWIEYFLRRPPARYAYKVLSLTPGRRVMLKRGVEQRRESMRGSTLSALSFGGMFIERQTPSDGGMPTRGAVRGIHRKRGRFRS
jgi:hypothetical protein